MEAEGKIERREAKEEEPIPEKGIKIKDKIILYSNPIEK